MQREARGPVRGQQLVDLAGGMGDDADQHVGKVLDHVDAGLTTAFDQGVIGRGCATTTQAARKEPVVEIMETFP